LSLPAFDGLHTSAAVEAYPGDRRVRQRQDGGVADERTLRRAVSCLSAVLGLGLVVAIVGNAIVGVGIDEALDSFQIPNLCVGVPAAACGVLLAWYRPRNLLGWLLAAAGTAQVLTSAVTPWLIAAMRDGRATPVARTLSTVYSLWPMSVAILLPLSILVFPDGRVLGRRWQALAALVVANGVLQVLLFSSDSNPLASVSSLAGGAAPSWLRIQALGTGWLQAVSNGLLGLGYLLVLASVVVRYRTGDEQRQRQLLWLIWAASLALCLLVGSRLVLSIENGFPILALAVIGLVPISMVVAVLRYQVLDIRLVWSRTVAWLLLTTIVLGAYLGLVAAGEAVLHHMVVGSAAVAALLVALAFHPARQWLQRGVDARLYGQRADPLRAASAVTSQLSGDVSTPADVVAAVRSALRLPYAELRDADGIIASDGTPSAGPREQLPLRYAGQRIGTLVVGIRTGQARLDPSDRIVLDLMTAPLALAVHATALAAAIERSRDELTSARGTERRRLRRDLHDGLGPLLTGIAFQVETARNLASADPSRVDSILDAIRTSVSDAIGEVRVLLDQLRPTTVEELGLTAALERHAGSLAERSDGTRLQTVIEADGLPQLPSQVETATYRIVTEALNNVARHSHAERVDIEFECNGAFLSFIVQDDGGVSDAWQPGVGLRSMQERIGELNGTISAGPTPLGGRVCARIPLEVP
jgi:two-component system, NarL family, sensor kinase